MKVHKDLRWQAMTLSLLVLFSLAACGPQGKKPDVPAGAHAEKETFTGQLDKKLAEIYNKENEVFFNSCDVKNRSKILEIGKALEKNRDAITALVKKGTEEAEEAFAYIGPYKFKDRPADVVAENKWISDSLGWPEIIEEFERIKHLPVGKEWAIVNLLARGIVGDDEDRLFHGNFMGLGRNSGPVMLDIKNVVDQCVAHNPCTIPPLTPEQKNFLFSSGKFKLIYAVLEKPTESLQKKRDLVFSFKKGIDSYLNKFSLKNYVKARVEGNTLVVPMDISTFASGESQAIELIEKTWNIDPEYKVKVEPIKEVKDIYVVKVSEEPNGRAFVDREKFLMQLYNFDSITVIPHEFGHILGFTDYYYTVWNPKTCAYEQEKNDGDIMSSSRTGHVLPEHWELLKKAYWNK